MEPVEAPTFRHWATTEGGYRIGHLGPAETCTNPLCAKEA